MRKKSSTLENTTELKEDNITAFINLLLDVNAPVMSDAQYADFLKNREHFNQWRTIKLD